MKREISGIGIGFGAYVSDTMALRMLYIDSDVDYSYENAPQFNASDSITVYGLQAKYVYEFPRQQAVNIEAGINQLEIDPENGSSESNNSFDFIATYYFNPKIGLSGSLSLQSGDTDSYKGTEYGAGLDAFVTENLALTVTYATFEADNSQGTDEDAWSAGVQWWF